MAKFRILVGCDQCLAADLAADSLVPPASIADEQHTRFIDLYTDLVEDGLARGVVSIGAVREAADIRRHPIRHWYRIRGGGDSAFRDAMTALERVHERLPARRRMVTHLRHWLRREYVRWTAVPDSVVCIIERTGYRDWPTWIAHMVGQTHAATWTTLKKALTNAESECHPDELYHCKFERLQRRSLDVSEVPGDLRDIYVRCASALSGGLAPADAYSQLVAEQYTALSDAGRGVLAALIAFQARWWHDSALVRVADRLTRYRLIHGAWLVLSSEAEPSLRIRANLKILDECRERLQSGGVDDEFVLPGVLHGRYDDGVETEAAAWFATRGRQDVSARVTGSDSSLHCRVRELAGGTIVGDRVGRG